jgi:outer membrane cobalamin receptor
MKHLFILFLLFISGNIFSQKSKLKGIVVDAKSKEKLIGVNIAIENTSFGTTTDEEGNYVLELEAGEHTLLFSYIGYDEKRSIVYLKKDEVQTLNIEVNETENILTTVVVSGSKFEKKMSEEIVSIDVIKPAFIEKQNVTELSDAIKRNPGVSIVDRQINIRGGSGWSFGAGSRVLVLLDGLPIQNPAAGDLGLPLPVESVGQIEIIKGAASALYGSSAMNGIVNLRTTFATNEPHTTLSFFGSVNDNPPTKEKYVDSNGQTQTESVDKRWWLQDSVTFLQPKLAQFLGSRDTTMLNPNRLRPHSFGFSFSNKQKIGKLDLVIGGLASKKIDHVYGKFNTVARFNINSRYRISNNWNIGVNINIAVLRGVSQFIWSGSRGVNKYLPSALTEQGTNSNFNVSIDPFLNYNDDKGNRHKIMCKYFLSANKNFPNADNTSSIYYAEYQYQRKIDKINMTFTTGATGSAIIAPKSPLYGNRNLASNNFAFYIQADNKFWKRLSTSFGFRLETNQMTESKREIKPVFRAGFNVEAAKYTFIRASFGQGYRFPTIAEKFILTDLGGFAVVPNPTLKSETGMSVELGIKQGIKLGKNFNAFIDAAAFYMQYNNMMEFSPVLSSSGIPIPSGVLLAYASQNIGNTRIYGTEVSLMGEGKFFGFPTTVVIGYTYVVPQYRKYVEANTNDIVNYNVLKYRSRHTLTTQWDIDFKGFNIGTNFQYFSFIENYDDIFNSLGIGLEEYRQTLLKKNAAKKSEKNKYKGTPIWDLRASYTFGKTNKYTFAFLVGNVLNKEYSLRPGIIESPRSYSFRLDLKF